LVCGSREDKRKGEIIMRDCDKCVWACRNGGCASWDCEFIDQEEAAKAWKTVKTWKDANKDKFETKGETE
jgi:hypothetical protein